MKIVRHGVLAGALLLSLAAIPVRGQEMPPPVQEIWDLEKAYWGYVQAGDVENYMTLWHDEFVGWPCQTPEPQRKDAIGDWVQAIRDNGWGLTYELIPKAVQRFDEAAVVQYSVQFIYDYRDGETQYEDTWWKVTHTWAKTGNSWWIIGGMCGLLVSDEGG